MDNQDRIKLFADACKESFEVAKDVKEQQDITCSIYLMRYYVLMRKS